jgi:hypothetical protein
MSPNWQSKTPVEMEAITAVGKIFRFSHSLSFQCPFPCKTSSTERGAVGGDLAFSLRSIRPMANAMNHIPKADIMEHIWMINPCVSVTAFPFEAQIDEL